MPSDTLILTGVVLILYAANKNNMSNIPDSSSEKLQFPMRGNFRITSPYGKRTLRGVAEFHNGIDIVSDDPNVYAPASGRVTKIYQGGKGANQMLITHANGYTTGYAEVGKYFVKLGDIVKQGQPVCTMGSGGNATGVHIHFAVHPTKDLTKSIDPTTLF